MKDFYTNFIDSYSEVSGQATLGSAWSAVDIGSITVNTKGTYLVSIAYSVPFNDGTYYIRVFRNGADVGGETKAANPYYNLKGTLTRLVNVEGSAILSCSIGSGQSSTVGKKCDYVMRVVKIE